MRNVGLLKLLAGVQEHTATATTLMASTGLDPLELQVAVTTAQEAGLVENTGEIHPSLRLTAEGWEWAKVELAPFARLLSDAAKRGAV